MTTRANVYVHGGHGCGKTSVVQSLIQGAPRAGPYPREDISMTPWKPTQQQCDTVEADTSVGSALIVCLWELSGNSKLEGLLPACICPKSLHLVLIDASASDVTSVANTWNLIQSKAPFSYVMFVVTKVDKILANSQNITETLEDMIGNIQKHEDHRQRHIQSLISKYATTNIQENETERLKKVEFQGTAIPTDAIFVSCKTGKGLEELSAYILKTILSTHTLSQPTSFNELLTTAESLDELLTTVRQDGDVFLLLSDFKTRVEDTSDDAIETLLRVLNTIGAIIDFGHMAYSDTNEAIICINPEVYSRCLYAIHVTDSQRTFLVESSRFWPETSGYKKPSAALLSRVIDSIPSHGLIREIIFPILLKEFEISAEQVRLLVSALQRLGCLTRGDNCMDDCEGLIMPGYQTSSVHAQYHLVHMDCLPDNPPRLHWTRRPFEGDMQLGWRYQFGPGTPAEVVRAVSAVCQSATAGDHTYLYQWKHGCLMRTPDCLICLEHDTLQLNIRCRRDVADLGCKQKTAQYLWVVLLGHIRASLQLLHTLEGVVYEVFLLPAGTGFAKKNEPTDESAAIPLDRYLWLYTRTDRLLDGTEDDIDLDLLFPFTDSTKPIKTLDDWLDLVSTKRTEYLPDCKLNRELGMGKLHVLQKNRYSRNEKKPHEIAKARCVMWDMPNTLAPTAKSDAHSIGHQEVSPYKAFSEGPVFTATTLDTTEHAHMTGDNNPHLQLHLIDGHDVNKRTEITTNTCEARNMLTSVTKLGNGDTRTSDTEITEMDGHVAVCNVGEELNGAIDDESVTQFVATLLAQCLVEYIEEEWKQNPVWREAISKQQIDVARHIAYPANSRQWTDIHQASSLVIDSINTYQHRNADTDVHRKTKSARYRFTTPSSSLCSLL